MTVAITLNTGRIHIIPGVIRLETTPCAVWIDVGDGWELVPHRIYPEYATHVRVGRSG